MTTRVRRQGFAGQHLVVVPDPVRRQARNHPLLRGLCVTDAGYFPRAANHRVERPLGSATDLIIACLRGQGWARVGGQTHPVGAGDVVWLPANHAHAYGAAAEDPWTIVWVHCMGDELPHWRKELGWSGVDALGNAHVTPSRIAELGSTRRTTSWNTAIRSPTCSRRVRPCARLSVRWRGSPTAPAPRALQPTA